MALHALAFRMEIFPGDMSALGRCNCVICSAGLEVDWDIYIDDVLISAHDAQTTKEATMAVAEALQRAAFIISDKSVLSPTTRISFLGKTLDCCRRSIGNELAMLAATFRMWVLALGTGQMHPRDMACMLGRLQWIARPVGASSLSLQAHIAV